MSERAARARGAAIFLKAARYIRKYGWQVEGMSVHGKPRCSMGALVSAYSKTTWEHSVASTMYDALSKELDGMTLTQFNHTVVDGGEVATLFERTASALVP